jgi:hypothetical protein
LPSFATLYPIKKARTVGKVLRGLWSNRSGDSGDCFRPLESLWGGQSCLETVSPVDQMAEFPVIGSGSSRYFGAPRWLCTPFIME